jgi:hypothetical protein
MDDIPDKIIQAYHLQECTDNNNWVYFHIDKGMYGLPQAGILANKLLAKCLVLHGYHEKHVTPQAFGNTTLNPSALCSS